LLLRVFLHPETTKAVHHAKEAPNKAVASPYRDRIYLQFIVCTVLFASCFFQLFSTLPLFYKRELGMPEYMIGLLLTINGLIISVVEMVLVFKLEGRRDNLYYVFFGVLAIGLSYLLLDVLPLGVPVAYFCMVVSTVGEMFAMSFLNSFWISRTSGSNRGRYAGLYTIAWSTAQVIGPTGGAAIAQRAGFTVWWWVVGGLCVVSAMAFRYLRQTQNVLSYE
jgi:predicted MFS family arabinose efflux permease